VPTKRVAEMIVQLYRNSAFLRPLPTLEIGSPLVSEKP
jgi:hypothetical protein